MPQDFFAQIWEQKNVDLSIELTSSFERDRLIAKINEHSFAKTLPEIMQELCSVILQGLIKDEDAQSVQTAFELRQEALREQLNKPTVAQRMPSQAEVWKAEGRSGFKDHIRAKLSKDQEKISERMERRRSLVAGGFIPEAIAKHFTLGQQAALAIIVQEVGKHGTCSLVIEKIAALAGVGHATVRRAINIAQSKFLNFLAVQYRPRRGKPSQSNIITIINTNWLSWIKNRFKKASAKVAQKSTKSENTAHFRFKNTECNPTPYTNIIKGNLLDADCSNTKKSDDWHKANRALKKKTGSFSPWSLFK